jgi:hypothetical protein
VITTDCDNPIFLASILVGSGWNSITAFTPVVLYFSNLVVLKLPK